MEQEIRWLLEEKYKGKLTPQAKKDIAKLKKGEHVDYLIGWKPFLNCAIDLRYKPLIFGWKQSIGQKRQSRMSALRIFLALYPILRDGALRDCGKSAVLPSHA